MDFGRSRAFEVERDRGAGAGVIELTVAALGREAEGRHGVQVSREGE